MGKKLPPTKTRKRNKLGINSQAGGRRGGGKCRKLVQTNKRYEQRDGERSKGTSAWKSALKNDNVRNALNSDWLEIR